MIGKQNAVSTSLIEGAACHPQALCVLNNECTSPVDGPVSAGGHFILREESGPCLCELNTVQGNPCGGLIRRGTFDADDGVKNRSYNISMLQGFRRAGCSIRIQVQDALVLIVEPLLRCIQLLPQVLNVEMPSLVTATGLLITSVAEMESVSFSRGDAKHPTTPEATMEHVQHTSLRLTPIAGQWRSLHLCRAFKGATPE
mmetsp:Transcript_116649/g.214263  ORF Transcript_116649/g.214263 Transcript_116649/m.214263 type:complete len:200 (-) Transcript_116649:43-642(-)